MDLNSRTKWYNYWQTHNINRIYGASYKQKSQGTAEGFNKIIEKELRKAYYNLKDDGSEFDVNIRLIWLYFSTIEIGQIQQQRWFLVTYFMVRKNQEFGKIVKLIPKKLSK